MLSTQKITERKLLNLNSFTLNLVTSEALANLSATLNVLVLYPEAMVNAGGFWPAVQLSLPVATIAAWAFVRWFNHYSPVFLEGPETPDIQFGRLDRLRLLPVTLAQPHLIASDTFTPSVGIPKELDLAGTLNNVTGQITLNPQQTKVKLVVPLTQATVVAPLAQLRPVSRCGRVLRALGLYLQQ